MTGSLNDAESVPDMQSTDVTRVNPWTRVSRSVVYENAWIAVYHDDVIRPDGQPGIYGVVHYRNQSVGVVAIDRQDQVLLVGQFRYTLGAYSWEIPAGGSLEGEYLAKTACRELTEETGYSAGSIELILHAHMSNSISDEVAFCFLATDLKAGQSAPEGTEKIQSRWVPFEQAVRMVVEREITDALTVLGIQQAALLRAGFRFNAVP